MHELVFFGGDAVILFELGRKIFFVAEIEHIRDLPNGIVAVFQPLLGQLHGGAHDVLIDGLLIFGLEYTAGVNGGNVKAVGNVCRAEILLQIFVDIHFQTLGQGQILFGDHVEIFGHFEDHAIEDGADLFQVVFCVQLMAETLEVFAEIHVADDDGIGKVKNPQQLIRQISGDVDPDLFVGGFGVCVILVIGEFGDQISIASLDGVIFAVALDMPHAVGDVFQNVKIPFAVASDMVGGVGIGDPHQLDVQK